MIGYDDIAAVIRQLDRDADDAGFEAICEKVGLDYKGTTGVATQRALRGVLLRRGIPLPKGRREVPVDQDDPDLLWGASLWIDGFLTGWRMIQSSLEGQHRTEKK